MTHEHRAPIISTDDLTADELSHLHRAVELAAEALETGDEPFGSVLVGADGQVLAEDRNRVHGDLVDHTRHPEFALARWAIEHLTVEERTAATTFTSGEHCPMCSAAHGWAGLGRIVYAHSAAQLTEWLASWDVPPAPVRPPAINEVAPEVPVHGPVPELTDRLRGLHRAFHQRRHAG